MLSPSYRACKYSLLAKLNQSYNKNMVLYMLIHETIQTTCWYHQGISVTSIPLKTEGRWDILKIYTNKNKIYILTPILNRFFKRCRLWAQALKWSRGLRQLRQRELGRHPYPSHCPQWRSQKQKRTLFWALEEVEGSMFLHGRIQRPSRRLPNRSEMPETRLGLAEE